LFVVVKELELGQLRGGRVELVEEHAECGIGYERRDSQDGGRQGLGGWAGGGEVVECRLGCSHGGLGV
jgi:hypothetical protein